MRLEGSCHCGAVRFSMETHTPYPYMRCYCTVCRKTGGGGGYAINLMAAASSLDVKGEDALTVYQAVIDGTQSQARRHFCGTCGTALWLFDPRWPDLIHPFASAIDSELPKPPQTVHIMCANQANWVTPDIAKDDLVFDTYPEESIEAWHERHGLKVD